ncbi:MAG TPA: alcohol dehydrogenase catalytic domain-containing protein, partial [Actinomycetota bacterium]|nr:alcohol dehydrogenase catalytic domain-containing protein [Actinomycetota bacterium]
MSRRTMRAARLHGLEDLRIDILEVPEAAPGELLVRIEANGVCATDARKYRVGVNDGRYPFNPGHEWVGHVEAVGDGVVDWEPGHRLYGDTYGGYAELTTIAVEPSGWSCGPTRLPD